jgi:hypothetical protein
MSHHAGVTDDRVPDRFRPVLEDIVRRLAAGDYDGVARDHSPYVDQEGFDLGMWARDYPDPFVPLPPEAWDVASAGPVDDQEGVWWVDEDLWSSEGRTDMTLSATVRDTSTGPKVEIRDLHVL